MWIDKNGTPSPGWIMVNVTEEGEEPRYLKCVNPTDQQYIDNGWTWVEPTPEPPDPEYQRRYQEYLAACEQFRTVCGIIKEFAGLDKFTGGFDEAMEFIKSEAFVSNMIQGTYLFSLWQGADKAATYAADKVGLGQPEWWYDCWKQVVPDKEVTNDTELPDNITSDTQQVEEYRI